MTEGLGDGGSEGSSCGYCCGRHCDSSGFVETPRKAAQNPAAHVLCMFGTQPDQAIRPQACLSPCPDTPINSLVVGFAQPCAQPSMIAAHAQPHGRMQPSIPPSHMAKHLTEVSGGFSSPTWQHRLAPLRTCMPLLPTEVSRLTSTEHAHAAMRAHQARHAMHARTPMPAQHGQHAHAAMRAHQARHAMHARTPMPAQHGHQAWQAPTHQGAQQAKTAKPAHTAKHAQQAKHATGRPSCPPAPAACTPISTQQAPACWPEAMQPQPCLHAQAASSASTCVQSALHAHPAQVVKQPTAMPTVKGLPMLPITARTSHQPGSPATTRATNSGPATSDPATNIRGPTTIIPASSIPATSSSRPAATYGQSAITYGQSAAQGQPSFHRHCQLPSMLSTAIQSPWTLQPT